MLIIEGSDCLGKTTFAKKLLTEAGGYKHKFPTYYSHMSRPNSSFNFFSHYRDMMSKYAIQDRFHLGGIVWHNAISQPRLEILDGQLKALGSMTIIMYASDFNWYRKRIEADDRGNLLSVDDMCMANKEYYLLANEQTDVTLRPVVDFKIDLTPLVEESKWPVFPNQLIVQHTIKEWFKRLTELENLK